MDFLTGKTFKPRGFEFWNKFWKCKCAETRKLFWNMDYVFQSRQWNRLSLYLFKVFQRHFDYSIFKSITFLGFPERNSSWASWLWNIKQIVGWDKFLPLVWVKNFSRLSIAFKLLITGNHPLRSAVIIWKNFH